MNKYQVHTAKAYKKYLLKAVALIFVLGLAFGYQGLENKAFAEDNADSPAIARTMGTAAVSSANGNPYEGDGTVREGSTFEINSIRFKDNYTLESKNLELDVLATWEGTGLKAGDSYVMQMPDEFDSITKIVKKKFAANGEPDFGEVTLDYNNRTITVKLLKDMEEGRIYNGTLKIGTFANRASFTDLVNYEREITFRTKAGKEFKNKVSVVYDITMHPMAEDFNIAYPMAEKMHLGDRTIDWVGIVNKAKNQMENGYIYLSPMQISKMLAEGDGHGGVASNGIEFVANAAPNYTILPETVEVYEAENVTDSFHYTLGKKLTPDVDYNLGQSQFDPAIKDQVDALWEKYDAETDPAEQAKIEAQIDELIKKSSVYVVRFEGAYANTNKTFVVKHRGKNESGDKVTFDMGVMYTDRANMTVPAYARGTEIYLNDVNANLEGTEVPKGTIIAVHIDDDTGHLIIPEEFVKKNEAVGADYKVIEGTNENYKGYQDEAFKNDSKAEEYKNAFDGYRLEGLGFDSEPMMGTVEEGIKRVFLYYKKIVGSVKVVYIDEATGQPIEVEGQPDPNAIEAYANTDSGEAKDKKVDTAYTTEEKTFNGYEFAYMGYGSAEKNGKVTEGTKTVVYVYRKTAEPEEPAEKTGNVILKYVDQEGNTIKADKEVANGNVGEGYEIVRNDEKNPSDLTDQGYEFVRVEVASDPEKGEIKEETQVIVYVYKKVTGNVTVKYVDQDGTPIAAEEKIVTDAKEDTAYSVDADKRGANKQIEGYTYKRIETSSDPEEGKISKDRLNRTIVYVYKKNEEPPVVAKKGSVKVVHVYEGGETVVKYIHENVDVDTEYTTSQEPKEGYEAGVVTTGTATGKVTEGETTIVYYYAKTPETPEEPVAKKGTVTIVYIDDKGQIIKTDRDKTEHNVNEKYQVNVDPEINVEDKTYEYRYGNGEITVKEGENTVVVLYAEKKTEVPPAPAKGTVVLVYMDGDGNVIKEVPVEEEKNVGDKYVVKGDDTITSDDGSKTYEYKYGNGEITVKEGENKVILLYKEKVTTPAPEAKKGSVKVVHIYEGGQTVTEYAVQNVDVDTPYTSEAKDKEGFEKGVVAVGDKDGVVKEGETTVIYYYAKTPAEPGEEPEAPKTGSVKVVHVYEGGETESEYILQDQALDTPYDANEKPKAGYEAGKITLGEKTGKVTEGETTVVYYYARTPEPVPPAEKEKGTITIIYVDDEGNKIKEKNVPGEFTDGDSYTVNVDNKITKDGNDYEYKYGNGEITVKGGNNKVIVLYKKVVKEEPKPPVDPKKGNLTIVYIDNEGNKLQADKVITGLKAGDKYTVSEKDQQLGDDVADKEKYKKVYGDESIIINEGENNLVYFFSKEKECEPCPPAPEKPEVTDNGTQTDPEPDPETPPVPEKPEVTDNGTQTDPEPDPETPPAPEQPVTPGEPENIKPQTPASTTPVTPSTPVSRGNGKAGNKAPKTGDAENIMLYTVLLAGAVAALGKRRFEK